MKKKFTVSIITALLSLALTVPAPAAEAGTVVKVPQTDPRDVESAMDVICAPAGILDLGDGSFLVTDTYNKVIWKVDKGISTVLAGGESTRDLSGEPSGGYNDGKALESLFKEPWAIAPFLDGYAVTDTANNTVRFLNADGTQTATGKRRPGFVDGKGIKASFEHPTGLAADEEGNLYVADTNNNAIRKITPYGEVTTFLPGVNEPTGLCWKNGSLYVAESGAHRILKVTGGAVAEVIGSGTEGNLDGTKAAACFSYPQGVAVSEDGILYISDTGNHAVKKVENGMVTTLFSREAEALIQYPLAPMGLMVSGDKLYVCDNFARKVLILTR